MSSVIQDWVFDIPWKMQSVMFTSLRGPDEHRDQYIKMANRWIRSKLLHDADPDNPFIVKQGDLAPLEIIPELLTALEYTKVHYFTHIMHTFQIIGFYHPDWEVRIEASKVYKSMVSNWHCKPESKEEMDARLSDVTQHV
jgi:hypothetical protein